MLPIKVLVCNFQERGHLMELIKISTNMYRYSAKNSDEYVCLYSTKYSDDKAMKQIARKEVAKVFWDF